MASYSIANYAKLRSDLRGHEASVKSIRETPGAYSGTLPPPNEESWSTVSSPMQF